MKKFISKLFIFMLGVVIVIGLWQAADPNSYIKCLITQQRISVIAEKVQENAELITATQKLDQIAENGTNKKGWCGVFDESITYAIYGEVVAGVNLSNFKPTDVTVINPNSIKIRINKAEIFYVVINNDKSKVIDHKKGLLAPNAINLESDTLTKAEADFKQAAENSNILNEANINAQKIIGDLYRGVGIQNISFVTK